MTSEYCCESDCVGCEVYGRIKEQRRKERERQRRLAQDEAAGPDAKP